MSRRRQQRAGSTGRPTARNAESAVNRLLLEAVAHHRAGRLGAAAQRYRRVLELSPRQADALHLLGVAAHQQGDHGQAQDLITRAIAVNGGDPTYHNNLGTVLLALARPGEAAESFARALALNPHYAEAHNNLGNACQQQGDLDGALAGYRRALRIQPGYAEAHFNLGRALHGVGELDRAVASYRHALAHNPRYLKAHRSLGDALGELGRPKEAEAQYRHALAVDPGDADANAAIAALWERGNRLDEALAAAEAALQRDARHVRAAVVAARCERRLGRPQAGLQRLERIHMAGLDGESRAFVAFETATILDRLGEYARAYDCFEVGNNAVLGGALARRLDTEAFPREIERLSTRFTAAWIAGWTAPVPFEGICPVFLVGFPRSGTTLLDQVLDAHPSLTALEEKPTVDVVKQELARLTGGYPDVLASLSPTDIHSLRRIYFDVAAKYGAGEDSLIVDKMPLNTIDIGLIHRLFPEAKVLLALRHPCDVVLSGFMQAFRPNPAMLHFASLESTARLYTQVMALWQRYAELLPLTALPTRYEDLVADLPAETRRILDFLELPWDDAILSYRRRAETRAIATPSYHQVVQPIYSRSVGRWRNYREQMEPVLPLLRPFIEAFGYSVD